MAALAMAARLLDVRDLRVEFRTRDGIAEAVGGVSYAVDAGRTLAVLGESGSGKSVTAQAIMGILDSPPGRITGGQVLFQGRDLLTMGAEERRRIRGAALAMIFQDALSALNPVIPVGAQLAEMYEVHRGMSRKDARRRAVELMDRVRIPAAGQRAGDYPHQFSGGMRQRIMIAMAMALEPDLIIADEPTTALDVTVQAQVMELLAELRREYAMGLVLITHDLGVVADVADTIAVMYAGRIVETAPVRDLYRRPAHPYTRGLLDSVPRVDHRGERLYAIKGAPPSPLALPPGCPFHPRCPRAQEVCRVERPPLYEVSADAGTGAAGGRTSACHFWKDELDALDAVNA
ncbi:ABC transporter ATP-binding protein [Streptomyces rapamycinicus]|nr:ABC transporter ATP-binding protein [Streptomyces rapamycinicus]MBB4782773.1 peptide/nickel transport system ATP-binding protein/oligopeptide transport system ATP-binding protein [Streptomyces rapamycinicus]UTP31205.1 ABC transporter ATP-binding protein [Streptomyces rapamycinicus NRRL 5491]